MVRLFDKRAEWFVGAGWLLLAIALPVAGLYSLAAGIHVNYFPEGENAPLYRSLIHITNAAALASVVAVVLPSTAFAFNFRVTASALSVGCWSLIVASHLLLLFLGLGGIERLTGAEPQQIERSVGSQRFSVPDHYRPTSAGTLDLPGFGFWI